MNNDQLISAEEFCYYHNVEVNLVYSFSDLGLIDLVTIEQKQFVLIDNLPQLEKLIRLHTELEINMEGIGAIAHLLEKIELLQQELISLKNKISVYELE